MNRVTWPVGTKDKGLWIVDQGLAAKPPLTTHCYLLYDLGRERASLAASGSRTFDDRNLGAGYGRILGLAGGRVKRAGGIGLPE